MPESAGAPLPRDLEIAKAALLEITPADTIGEPAGTRDEGQGTVTIYFDSKKAGYPGWRWTVSIAHVEGSEPTVLETELTPGDAALLSPDWVPWADRLADYQAAQESERAAAAGEDSESDDDESDDDDYYDDDPDDDDEAMLHGGDLDGVDIDEIADDSDDDSDDDDEDDTDDDDSDADDDE